MTEASFINEIMGELTISGLLPQTINENEVRRIAKQERRFFLEKYEYATHEYHYVIPKSAFDTEEFRSQRTIQLPECVIAVSRVQEINGVGRLGNMDKDFSADRLIASEIFLSSSNQGDDLVMRTANYSFYDLGRAFFLDIIQFDHNKNTHELRITGRNPRFPVYIKTWNAITDDHLYDDYIFLRWVTAKCKISFSRLVGTFPFPLPGNVTINGDMWRSEGEAELEYLKERINTDGNQVDWLMIMHLHPISVIFIFILYLILMLGGGT